MGTNYDKMDNLEIVKESGEINNRTDWWIIGKIH